MHNRLYFNEQDIAEILQTIGFSSADNYSRKWDGTYVSKMPTDSNMTGENKLLTGWDLDNNYGKAIRLNFVSADGMLFSSEFCITNDEFMYIDSPDNRVDYSDEWKSQLLKNYPKDYAEYLMAKYQRTIKNIKDENRKLGKKLSQESRRLENLYYKDYDGKESKVIMKNKKQLRRARLDNEEKISFYKRSINELQKVLDSVEQEQEIEL